MPTAQIYLIPGLGADGRMYQSQIRLFSNATILEHLVPLTGESISEYAQRLAIKVNASKPFILIGTSLGGIIAQEMCRYITPEKVILISSVKESAELPPFIRAMKTLRLHRLLSGERLIALSRSRFKHLLVKRSNTVSRLIMEMHQTANPRFIEWAINEVVSWQGEAVKHIPITHIHGTRDILFPIRYIRKPEIIVGGTHVMGLTQPSDVNAAILKALEA